MLRICEDCIHNEVCNEWAVTSGIPFVSANTCENFMTADVAPKSEVALEVIEYLENNGLLNMEPWAIAELKKKYTEGEK